MARQTVSMVMTVRDEATRLPGAIRSVSDLVDEVVVAIDSRTCDDTKDVAARLGARAVDFEWTDSFADARNVSIEHARCDWIFWFDGDETIDEANRSRFAALVASLQDENVGYRMTQISRTLLPFPSPGGEFPGSEFIDQEGKQVRLFRRNPAIRWQLRVFEQIQPAVRASGGLIRESDVVIHHAGLQDMTTIQRKAQRNLRLALMQDAETPNDPYNLMYIGESLIYLGRARDALDYLRKSVALFPPTARTRGKSVMLLAAVEREMRGEEQSSRGTP